MFFPLKVAAESFVEKDMSSMSVLGTHKDMGNYEACVRMPNTHHVLFFSGSIGINLGLCLPKSCTAHHYLAHLDCLDYEVNETMQQLVGQNANLSKAIAQAANMFVQELPRAGINGESSDDVVSLGEALTTKPGTPLVLLLVVAIILASAAGLIFPQAVDLRESVRSLFAKRRPGQTDFLDAIRTLSTFYVILGHVFLISVQSNSNVFPTAPDLGNSGWALFIVFAFMAVDTFFWLSGFFVAVGMSKPGAEMPEVRKYGLGVLFRYLRLTPVYALSLLVYAYLLPYLGSGPLFRVMLQNNGDVQRCQGNLWPQLFYANNVISGGEPKCGGWGWYLTLDMQCFLILSAPLAFWHRRRLRKYIVAVLALIVVGAVVAGGVWSESYESGALALAGDKGTQSLYNLLWYRIGAYAVGVLAGLCWQEGLRPTGGRAAACGAFGALVFLAVFFLPWSYFPEGGLFATFQGPGAWSRGATNLWNALLRPGYAVALTGVVFGLAACPAWAVAPLNAKFWEPLARLSYGAYLWHFPFMFYYMGTATGFTPFTVRNVLVTWALVTVGGFGFAAVTYVFVEAPIARAMRPLAKPAKPAVDPLATPVVGPTAADGQVPLLP
jgi:peptidoglycan/LPS O-acetylase OafA/YrhL